jgi:hypothetical protein
MVTAKRLVVEAVRSDNSTTVLSDDNRAGGTHTFSFNSDSLPEGQYEYVRATWYLFGDPPNSSNPNSTRVVAFRALGTYRHSQYNTPWEGTCSAGPAQREVFSNAPPWSPSCSGLYVTQLRWDFAVQVETNGSGISNSVGYLHTVAGTSCNNQGAHFYNIPSITGSHGPVSDTTVAKVDSHAHLNYSDDVLIVGAPINTKTVTDTCPGCTQTQLDNYNQGAACSARAFLDYGNFPTIRLR